MMSWMSVSDRHGDAMNGYRLLPFGKKKNVGLISGFLSSNPCLSSSVFSLCLQNAFRKTSKAHIHPADIDVLMVAFRLVSVFGKIQVHRMG